MPVPSRARIRLMNMRISVGSDVDMATVSIYMCIIYMFLFDGRIKKFTRARVGRLFVVGGC